MVNDLSEHDWRRLAENIQRGTCVLLLGPAVAVDPSDPQHTPLTVLLARHLANELNENLIVDRDNLAHVSQLYTGPGRDRMDLELAVGDFYSRLGPITTPLHRQLAELPFTLCVNTTPDGFMARAFEEAGKKCRTEHYNFRRQRSAHLAESDSTHPIAYDLCGCLKEPDSLVLTESDLLDFLVTVISKTPPLPPFITSRFSDPTTSFLFVGFGFQNWYIRILLHILAQGHKTRSLALEDARFFQHPEQPQAMIFFEKQHLIAFKLLSWEGFVAELKQHQQDLIGRKALNTEPPSDAPLVFLCHSHEDRDAVMQLSQTLQNNGLRVWLDRQSLRGGDEWDRTIPTVLRKVDYVVVVQGRHLHQRVESYVYKEVRIALERQSRFASGYRFIIPVNLEPCIGLSECESLQTVDLSENGGIVELVKTILEDWEKRKRIRGRGENPEEVTP